MADEKRLVDANALKAIFDKRYDNAFMQSHTRPNIAWWEGYSAGVNWGRNTITDVPTVDAVEVIRCKDCKYWKPGDAKGGNSIEDLQVIGGCKWTNFCRREMDFCSFGERKENG